MASIWWKPADEIPPKERGRGEREKIIYPFREGRVYGYKDVVRDFHTHPDTEIGRVTYPAEVSRMRVLSGLREAARYLGLPVSCTVRRDDIYLTHRDLAAPDSKSMYHWAHEHLYNFERCNTPWREVRIPVGWDAARTHRVLLRQRRLSGWGFIHIAWPDRGRRFIFTQEPRSEEGQTW